MSSVNINRLYKQALNGGEKAEEVLFGQLSDMFQLFVRQRAVGVDDRDDIVQTALCKISQAYRQVSIISSFAAWAHTILKNELIEHFRRVSLRHQKLSDLAAINIRYAGPSDPDPTFKSRLRSCLISLRNAHPRQARVLNLHYHGFTATEISKKLDIDIYYCRVMLFRARSRLASCLKKRKANRG
jgi:RNA polymerase sigma factor (sigma-70 family)